MESRPIKGYEGAYNIFPDGRIWSVKNSKFLKPGWGRGYKVVCLSHKGTIKGFGVHRLVYRNFVGEIPAGLQINHKDGVKLNNDVTNLEVCTPLENTRHAWRIGLARKYSGSEVSTAKLNEEKVVEIFRMHRVGISNGAIARKFGVCWGTIYHVLKGKTWCHVKA